MEGAKRARVRRRNRPADSRPPAEPASRAEPPRPEPRKPPAPVKPESLATILDDALGRMQRRASGEEQPIPLPWSNIADALGGGLWGGNSVTLLGNTGSGKTQWALQAALHAAEGGVPVCYLALELGVQQVAARLLGLKGGKRWADLYLGHSGPATLRGLRATYAGGLKALPFHLVGDSAEGSSPPRIRAVAEWMRKEYPEGKPGTRPVMVVVDFLQLLGSGTRDWDMREMMARAAREARATARELSAAVLLVSASSRENYARPERRDKPIGVHRDRRRPPPLGEGNPARLLTAGREPDEVEFASDIVLVLAEEPWTEAKSPREATRVWCAVAKNRAGSEAWCALRFNKSRFEVDPDVGPEQPRLNLLESEPEPRGVASELRER